jgi:hypothetical protein
LNTNLISAKLGWEHSLFCTAHERHGTAIVQQEVVKTIAKQVVIALVLVKWE